MESTKKMTKREMFETILVILAAVEADKELSDGIQHELDLLAKRAASKGGNAKKEAEQNKVMADIAAVLDGADEPMRAGDIAKSLDVGIQKVTAMLKKMVDAGTVTRTEEKKVAFFSID